MRRVTQCFAFIFIFATMTYAVAGSFDYTKEDMSGYSLQPHFVVNDSSSVSRDGHAVYFFGGYMYTERFLHSSTQTVYNPLNDTTYAYTPKSVFPSSYSGLELGIGKQLTRFINVEMAYNQQFVAKKTGTVFGVPFSTSVKMNGVLADVGFVFDPDSVFQVMAKLGVQLSQFNDSASFSNQPSFTLNDSTKVDPAAGVEFLFQFNRHFGLRVDTMYVAETQSSNSNGEANILAGLNYTL